MFASSFSIRSVQIYKRYITSDMPILCCFKLNGSENMLNNYFFQDTRFKINFEIIRNGSLLIHRFLVIKQNRIQENVPTCFKSLEFCCHFLCVLLWSPEPG